MPKCVYCGKMYEFPKGLSIVKNSGSVNYFCSSKCRKNSGMKRRKARWISKQKKSKKEIQQAVKAQAKTEHRKESSASEKSKSKKSGKSKK